MLFFAVVWSVWEVRNDFIFNSKTVGMDQSMDMVKIRIVWWFKNHGLGSSASISTLLLNINKGCSNMKVWKKAVRRLLSPLPRTIL